EYKITPCSVGQILVPCLKNVRDLALGVRAFATVIYGGFFILVIPTSRHVFHTFSGNFKNMKLS
ncbi:hypothetical protein, partial [Aeromonas veronii]|uniref:hypothetical protein n=1 Tax=Aeromonas veronii TaxID=654 RepID=UPI003BA12A83